jgi:class 3 adenylate cyclase
MKQQIYIILSLLLIITGCNAREEKQQVPVVVNGYIDLSGWDFEEFGTIDLTGEWLFAWKRLITPEDINGLTEGEAPGSFLFPETVDIPGIWNKKKIAGKNIPGSGYATFMLSVYLPETSKENVIAFKMPYMYTAYTMWINGKKVAINGRVGTDKESMTAQYLPQVASYTPRRTTLTIIVQVSNFLHRKGGMPEPIQIGNFRDISNKRVKKLAFELFIAGSLFIMGFYHLILFLYRRKERHTLYFGIYCFAIVLRTLLMGERFFYVMLPNFPWFLGQKLDYLSIILVFPFFILFLRSLFKKEMIRYVPEVNLVICIIFSLLVVVTPARIFTHFLKYFQGVIVILGIITIYVLIKAAVNKRSGAVIILIGELIYFITAINDVLYNNGIIYTGFFSPVGLLVFTLLLSFQLSSKYSILSNLLEDINISLRRFVPEEFLKFLGKENIVDVHLGDRINENMTVLFNDIRGFTSISEGMTPKQIFDFLNTFLQDLCPIIRKYGGFIDKYIGDAIMALFPGSVENAIDGAIEMDIALKSMNKKYREHGMAEISMGTGIHTGKLMLGIIGEEQRVDSTVISDVVNVASRIEGLNKRYGSKIIITNDVFKIIKTGTYNIRSLGLSKVRGKREQVHTYEVFDTDDHDLLLFKSSTRGEFEKAVNLIAEKEYGEAEKIFSNLAGKERGDRAVLHFLKEVSQLVQKE